MGPGMFDNLVRDLGCLIFILFIIGIAIGAGIMYILT